MSLQHDQSLRSNMLIDATKKLIESIPSSSRKQDNQSKRSSCDLILIPLTMRSNLRIPRHLQELKLTSLFLSLTGSYTGNHKRSHIQKMTVSPFQRSRTSTYKKRRRSQNCHSFRFFTTLLLHVTSIIGLLHNRSIMLVSAEGKSLSVHNLPMCIFNHA